MRDTAPEYTFQVTSGFGAQTRQPFVEVEVLPTEFSVKMSPQDATALALNLLEAAEAARTDGWLVNYLATSAGFDDSEIAVLLGEFRHWRAGFIMIDNTVHPLDHGYTAYLRHFRGSWHAALWHGDAYEQRLIASADKLASRDAALDWAEAEAETHRKTQRHAPPAG